MASTDTYAVWTLFTEEGYGGVEMKVYCTPVGAHEDYRLATTDDPMKCDHCDVVVLGSDSDAFQPFVTEDPDAIESTGYVACLPCYVQGVANSGVDMVIAGERTVTDVACGSSGRHAA